MTWLENSMKAASNDQSVRRRRTVPTRRGADAYDSLLWRLEARLDSLASADVGAATMVGVTACERRAGVSTIAANLAIRAADHCMGPVLLIDAATERPVQARRFGLKKALGLTDLLAERCGLRDAAHRSHADGLDVMPIGSPRLIGRIGLSPDALDAMLAEIRASYELVFVDLPAAPQLRQTLLLARRLDASVLAVRSEATRRDDVRRTASQLRTDGALLVGCVLSRRRRHVPRLLAKWL
ncbi:CpsD/CapB family tyrosine-protein kinase [Botrimarina sp.]|uniref:CpsD/CapB family tyrosine-protein kinase n=1 Tax=Botrimarina sp. TaxID=2795802 RepID=UPI0032EB1240